MQYVTVRMSEDDYNSLIGHLKADVDDGSTRAARYFKALTSNPVYSTDGLPSDFTEAIRKYFDQGWDFVGTVKQLRDDFNIPLMKARKHVDDFLVVNLKYRACAPKWRESDARSR